MKRRVLTLITVQRSV